MANMVILVLIYAFMIIVIIYGIFGIINDFKYAIKKGLGLDKIRKVNIDYDKYRRMKEEENNAMRINHKKY